MDPRGRWQIPYGLRHMRWWKAGRQPKYPGMKREEEELMNWFWERHTAEYVAAAYNVRVGLGRPSPEWADEALQRDWQMSTQLRIDALLWDSERLTVVEIKPLADAEAFGQAYLYARLLRSTYYVVCPIRSIVVAEDVHPDLIHMFVLHDIPVYVRSPLTLLARVSQPQ